MILLVDLTKSCVNWFDAVLLVNLVGSQLLPVSLRLGRGGSFRNASHR